MADWKAEIIFRSAEMTFWWGKNIFRSAEMVFRLAEMVFRLAEIIFQSAEMTFRWGKTIFWWGKISFRLLEIVFRWRYRKKSPTPAIATSAPTTSFAVTFSLNRKIAAGMMRMGIMDMMVEATPVEVC